MSGENGFIVAAEARAYAAVVLRLFGDPAELSRIRTAAARDAKRYMLNHMVQRFIEGIEGCLAAPRKR